MRISDWSSDVCSSDLLNALAGDHPGRLHALPLDVADPKSHAPLAPELPLALGDGERLDLLVNAAGVLHSGERFGKVRAALRDARFRTNAAGTLRLTQALAPLLGERPRGAIPACERGQKPTAAR